MQFIVIVSEETRQFASPIVKSFVFVPIILNLSLGGDTHYFSPFLSLIASINHINRLDVEVMQTRDANKVH